ncbi:MAG: amino acid permease [Bacteroidetes bacterium]|nr:amino acid permease [Bacteroidota bacterium]
MVGGGIFSILGISVEKVGHATPLAILCGGVLAFFAAYSYVKLAALYKDEGATYSFFKKTFPRSKKAAAVIGWLIVFGYISTLALYAFTFASYFCSQFKEFDSVFARRLTAAIVIAIFTIINYVSVKGMGKIEDFLVYTKLILLILISVLFARIGDFSASLPLIEPGTGFTDILMVAAITFVAYEGFQLVIHAYREMKNPGRNIPLSIYLSIGIAVLLYIFLAMAAMAVIPKQQLITGQEYALASGAKDHLGSAGSLIVILGALLATSSAISGTIFGASRLTAVIAEDGYLPEFLGKRRKVHIPGNAIILLSSAAFLLIASGGLKVILEFGSITFITVSFLMALSNYKVRKQTNSGVMVTLFAMISLLGAGLLIIYFEIQENLIQIAYILLIYFLLVTGALIYSGNVIRKIKKSDFTGK